jgi:hypothetical protein
MSKAGTWPSNTAQQSIATDSLAAEGHHLRGISDRALFCAPVLYSLRINGLIRSDDAMDDMALAQLRTGILEGRIFGLWQLRVISR